MNIGHVKFIQPNNPLLKKLIKGYYVHTSDDPDFYSKVTFYQNITTTISIYKDSLTSSIGRNRKQVFKKNRGYNSLLVGLVDKYQQVEFFGPLDRLAIVFYPLGVNHFIRKPISELLLKHYSSFDHFDKDFDSFLDVVYNKNLLEDKRDLLDDFFLKKYQPFDENQLKSAVQLLIESKEALKVADLSDRLGMSRRTLLRKFKIHTGYSISEYISIIKFRKALINFQNNPQSGQLTKIALNSNYYDQADFNHNIKNRSDLTPTELFAQLNIVDDTLFWKL